MFKRIFNGLIIAPLDFLNKYFKLLVLFIVLVLLVSSAPTQSIVKPNLAVITLEGPILNSKLVEDQLEVIHKNPHIRGVLLRIDSPGGAVGASVEIADLIRELNYKMPVVAYAEGIMASGSYYAGMYAHTIVANRGALIGSIGVILQGFNISPLMDKMGIESQGLSAGKYKDAGSIFRKWDEEEKQYLQDFINKQYDMFTMDVLEARGIKHDAKVFAEGKIFTAKDALELGLIDMLGSKENAINILLELSGVKDPVWLERDKFDLFIDKLTSRISSEIINQGLKIALY